ncbi:type I polyketide synthase [Vreelandella massiliensis]|uniref:type I polyketide synthase n=1 Tax=Vreelandella massiliensis TaxID=1816686 RepID=UPI00096ABA1F|nr:type I polyketide synthase [Halomonas massiliensis]
MSPIRRPAAAIVGIGSLFPGSSDTGGFWRDVVTGRDCFREVPSSHWLVDDYFDADPSATDKVYARRGAFIEPQPFEPLAFGIPPSILSSTDSVQVLSLMVARRVLEEATRAGAELGRDRIGVILGVTGTTELCNHSSARLQRPIWVKALRETGMPEDQVQVAADRIAEHYIPWREDTFPGLLNNVAAGRIANKLDLHGTNFTTDSACASSFSALAAAADELAMGRADLMIVGGADTMNDVASFACFSATPALSPTEGCRPFSVNGDGTLLGEGVGLIALRRLEEAEAEEQPIYAVIRGIGSASDGRGVSVYAPHSEGQARALRRAYDEAGFSPRTVGLVEAHGTGTRAGDAAEFAGLRTVFREEDLDGKQWCALGSVKSQIGHTKGAAGVAGLIKAALAVNAGILPPTLKAKPVNPGLELDQSPFHIAHRPRPWISDGSTPRRAGISSFGFGGSNFHVALEAYHGPRGRQPRVRALGSELVAVSSHSADALVEHVRALAARERLDPACMARETQRAFHSSDTVRLTLIARGDSDAIRQRLERAALRVEEAPNTSFELPDGTHYGAEKREPGKIAFLFPGQGSQYLYMGAGAAMHFDAARAVWEDEAKRATAREEERIDAFVFPPPADTEDGEKTQEAALRDTQRTQPGIAGVSMSLLALLRALGLQPDLAAGHSFGEITALHAAGVLSAADTFALARARGKAMASAATASGETGAMLAVQADAASLEEALTQQGAVDITVANVNSPTQTVLAGPEAAIDHVAAFCADLGMNAVRLPVAAAFHSPQVAPASDQLAAELASMDIHSPTLPVLGNADADAYPDAPDAIRDRLAKQLTQPVRFADQIEALYEAGARTFVEVGPGQTLSRFADQCLGERPHRSITLERRDDTDMEAFWIGVGRLLTAGVNLDLDALWEEYHEPEAPPVSGPGSVFVSGTLYGKPYPPKDGAAGIPGPNAAADQPGLSTPTTHTEPKNHPKTEPNAAIMDPISYTEDDHRAGSADTSSRPSYPPGDAAQDVSPPHSAPASRDASASTIGAVHRELLAAHTAYQESTAAAHEAFLAMMERSLAGAPAPSAAVSPTAPAPGNEPPPRHAAVNHSTAEEANAPRERADTVPTEPHLAPAAQANTPAPSSTEVAEAPTDAMAVLRTVIAEKTGYPEDMLTPELELEGSLGIDSIKRVEIFAALQQRLPGMPAAEPSEVAGLRSLAEVEGFLSERMGTAPVNEAEFTAAVEATQQAQGPSAEPTTSGAGAVMDTLLAVIAEKTGYPVDMLEPTLELEGSLGIDSIKRVEIFAALQQRLPTMPSAEPSEVAGLRTLADVVSFLEGGASDGEYNADTAALASSPASSTVPNTTPSASPSPSIPEPTLPTRAVPTLTSAHASGEPMPALATAKTWLILADHQGVASALQRLIEAEGGSVQIIDLDTESLPEHPPSAMVYLRGIETLASPWEASQELQQVLALARKLAAHPESQRLWVTVQDTNAFGLGDSSNAGSALQAGLAGVSKTAASEWPSAGVKSLDMATDSAEPQVLAARLWSEMQTGGRDVEVAINGNGDRYTIRAASSPSPVADKLPLSEGELVVVTGGARGVTAECVLELAGRVPAHFLLLGRTEPIEEPACCAGINDLAGLRRVLAEAASKRGEPLSPAAIDRQARHILAGREILTNIDRIRATGAHVEYQAVDVTSSEDVQAAVNAARRNHGPVRGVIHAAGVIADRALADKTPVEAASVIDTKLQGFASLLAATGDDELRLLVVFSSAAARYGNAGQADYAAANEVLNKWARIEAASRGDDCVVKSFNWGPWNGGMVDEALARHFRERGLALIEPAAGARLMVDELAAGDADIEILVGDAMPNQTH